MKTITKVISINLIITYVVCAPPRVLPTIEVNDKPISNDGSNKNEKSKEMPNKTYEINVLKEIDKKTNELNEEAKELKDQLNNINIQEQHDDNNLIIQTIQTTEDQTIQVTDDGITNNSSDIKGDIREGSMISNENNNIVSNNILKNNVPISKETPNEDVNLSKNAKNEIKSSEDAKGLSNENKESSENKTEKNHHKLIITVQTFNQSEENVTDRTTDTTVENVTSTVEPNTNVKNNDQDNLSKDNNSLKENKFPESNESNKKSTDIKGKDSVINSVEIDDSGNKITKCNCKSSSQTINDEVSDDVNNVKPVYEVIYDVVKKNNKTLQDEWVKLLKYNHKILRRKRESDVFGNFLHNFENNMDIDVDDPFKQDDGNSDSKNKNENEEVKGEKIINGDTDIKYYHKKNDNMVKTKIDEKKDNDKVHEENVFYHYSVENKNGNENMKTESVNEIIKDFNNDEPNINDQTQTSTTTTTTTTSTTTTITTTPSPIIETVMNNLNDRNFNDVNAMMNDDNFGNFGNVFKNVDDSFKNMENKMSNDFFGNQQDTTKQRVIEIKF